MHFSQEIDSLWGSLKTRLAVSQSNAIFAPICVRTACSRITIYLKLSFALIITKISPLKQNRYFLLVEFSDKG